MAAPRHDVVVVGAGLAGLRCAGVLSAAGLSVLVVEASERVGGRARTDVVDGYRLDRGFQVVNPAYPAVREALDLDALGLRRLPPGITLLLDGRRYALGWPLRGLAGAWDTLAVPPGGARRKAALAALLARAALLPVHTLVDHGDEPLAGYLARRSGEDLVDRVLRPVLSGVLLDAELATSRRFGELVLRSFCRGVPGVPAQGMGALAESLADRLPPGCVELGRAATGACSGEVRTADGAETARAVVVATDAEAAADLVGTPRRRWHAVTTYYHLAPFSPGGSGRLAVDGDEDLIANSIVISDAVPPYSPPGGRALVASSVLGVHGRELEPVLAHRLSVLHGCDTSQWELLATYPVERATPEQAAGMPLRRRVRLDDRLYACGDHRDTPSIQGALFSGWRAASAVLQDLGVTKP